MNFGFLINTFSGYQLKKCIKSVALALFLFMFASFSLTAQVSRAEVLSAYIFNFAKLTESEACNSLKTYNIILLSKDKKFSDDFKKIISKEKINNKPVNVDIHSYIVEEYNDVCIVFLTQDMSDLFPEIKKRTEGKEVLIVTENYFDKRKIMLNLYDTEDDRILFEINKANIYERNIEINDKILLIGGTEIDIIELYLKAKNDLIKNENIIMQMEIKQQNLQDEIKMMEIKSRALENSIIEKNRMIDSQKNEQLKLKEILTENQKQVKYQQNLIRKDADQLIKLKIRLKENLNQIEKQKSEYQQGEAKLFELKDEIRRRDVELRVQEATLGEQYNVIEKQRQIQLLFLIITGLGIFIAIMLFFALKYRKRKNKLLREQKQEIIQTNESLGEHLEEIRAFNEQLVEKNDKLADLIEKLKQTQQQLVESEKMASLGVLTAGIAHEINNPVNFIFTGINSLKKDFEDINVVLHFLNQLKPDDKKLNEKFKELYDLKEKKYFNDAFASVPQTLEDISVGAERTAEIVEGLRKFSRTDKELFIATDIKDCISPALLILKNKYKNRIRIIKDYDKKSKMIELNPGKITQVFMNILYNSIDAIKEEGSITIITDFNEDFAEIIIKDDGCGISKSHINKVFDPFFTTKDVGQGTGLGLAITYGIIKDHNGEIKVFSEEGVGTEFKIIIPIKQTDEN